ncbi:MAG: hypothetical protein AAF483_02605 [Planctomycetota bacterium]
MINRLLTHAFAYLLLPSLAIAQDDYKLEREVDLAKNFGGFFSVKADLGDLPPNTNVVLDLVVKNRHPVDLAVGKSFSGCGCLEVTLADSTIRTGESVVITTKLRTRSTSVDSHVIVPFDIELEGQPDISCKLRYRIGGMVTFPQHMVVQRLGDRLQDTEMKVPFLVHAPSDPAHITVRFSPELEDLLQVGEITRNSLSLAILPSKREQLAKSVSGTVDVTDSETGAKSSLFLVLKPQQDLTVVPSTLRFKKTEDGYSANAMIRVMKAEGEANINRSLDVQARFDDFRLKCEANQLSSQILKVKLTCAPPEKAELGEIHQMKIIVIAAGEEYIEIVPVRFEHATRFP